MRKRRIGALEVSLVGLGCNNFGMRCDFAQTTRVIDTALDAGIDFFDTADIYGGTKSEEFLGRALAGRRQRVVLATKFGMKIDDRRQGAKPDYVRSAVADSLQRLRTDYIDLYQLHQPDPQTKIAETLAALDDLVRSGQVREIGCSNFSAAQIREAEEAVRDGAARFVSVQNEYSLLHRAPEAEVLPECARRGLAFLPYFPLASGLLTGKVKPGEPPPSGSRLAAGRLADRFLTERNRAVAERLLAFCAARGRSLLELAFSWLAARPAIASIIAGATSPEQVRANAAAVDWELSAEELRAVDDLAAIP